MIVWIIILISLSYISTSEPAIAQTTPRPVNPNPQPVPQVEPLPPPDDLLQPPPTPSLSPESPPLQIPGQITVTQFVVVGSTVFSSTELAEILEPFTSRPISFAELLQAQTAVTQLYFDRGYVTSGAFIPPQTLQDGTVTIEVIEGIVEAIEISGLKRLNSGYIRSRIESGIKTPLNQDDLFQSLQLLQLDPLVERLSANLTAGSRPGLSRLEIEVEEAPAFLAQLSADNLRSPSVGTVRRQVQLSHSNLTGFGDRLNATYYNTDGSDTLDDFSYTIPINSKNGTISFRHRRTSSQILEEFFDVDEVDIDLETNSRTYEVSVRQPIYQTLSKEIALGFTGSVDESKTTLNGTPFSALDSGAEDDGEIRISSVRFFQEYTSRSTNDVFVARSEFSLGINAFDATVNDQAPDGRYFSWRGQAQYLRLFAPDTVFLIRSDIQLAPRSLFPQEQFSLGGGLSVRGYRQDALLGDNGLFISSEFRFPILRVREWDATLQLTPFVDFGTVWNSNDVELTEETLSSVGVGLRIQVGTRFSAQLDWGIPFVDIETNGDSLQEDGIYFYIRYRAF
ncbi:MAG: ShlB/FhaC/HecB family hemolysin secretion/activation protein [Okeania sp. SIO3B5]|uniref:ShlB/FhaC/HecB family hemolysin secretion/activation protein n=1 Tax=Okeania sp. SIO3B5 TaxID=2607811 RepID=UPI0014011897|nr:ShlB/FhaC/HecB family hemolysin secretion/activation protein [Okeania sp. SIO3B5]NEO54226.1 ShlB/FhaC/HecB family hemolysin secretion/activation protein [Okeania sp. SIO3B5]